MAQGVFRALNEPKAPIPCSLLKRTHFLPEQNPYRCLETGLLQAQQRRAAVTARTRGSTENTRGAEPGVRRVPVSSMTPAQESFLTTLKAQFGLISEEGFTFPAGKQRDSKQEEEEAEARYKV